MDGVNNYINNNIDNEIVEMINKFDKDNDKDTGNNDKDNNKLIMEVSPNGEYLVTYKPEDRSIVGWNVKRGQPRLKQDTIKTTKIDCCTDQICVSNNKKLAYTFYDVNNDESDDDTFYGNIKCYPSKNYLII